MSVTYSQLVLFLISISMVACSADSRLHEFSFGGCRWKVPGSYSLVGTPSEQSFHFWRNPKDLTRPASRITFGPYSNHKDDAEGRFSIEEWFPPNHARDVKRDEGANFFLISYKSVTGNREDDFGTIYTYLWVTKSGAHSVLSQNIHPEKFFAECD